MIIAELEAKELHQRLSRQGLAIKTGPVVCRVQSSLPTVHAGIGLHYAAHEVLADSAFCDFHVGVDRPRNLRRWWRPQAVFTHDGQQPFTPLPLAQAFALLEWGLNWCVYGRCNFLLSLHSAVLERDGRALLLPAHSGSGKSTLCAALSFRGWRLLSDELALVEPGSGRILPLPRPISLKNASIEVVRAFAPGAAFGPVVRDTIKGSICHVRPPATAVALAQRPARPTWVVFPSYAAGASARLDALGRAEGFMRLLEQAFNIGDHGPEGFETLADLAESVRFFSFRYGQLDDAVAVFNDLATAA